MSASFPSSSLAFGPGGVTTIRGFCVSTFVAKPFHRNATAWSENCKRLASIYRTCDGVAKALHCNFSWARRLGCTSSALSVPINDLPPRHAHADTSNQPGRVLLRSLNQFSPSMPFTSFSENPASVNASAIFGKSAIVSNSAGILSLPNPPSKSDPIPT